MVEECASRALFLLWLRGRRCWSFSLRRRRDRSSRNGILVPRHDISRTIPLACLRPMTSRRTRIRIRSPLRRHRPRTRIHSNNNRNIPLSPTLQTLTLTHHTPSLRILNLTWLIKSNLKPIRFPKTASDSPVLLFPSRRIRISGSFGYDGENGVHGPENKVIYEGHQHQCSTALDLRIDFWSELEIIEGVEMLEVLEEHVAVPLPDFDALLQKFRFDVPWSWRGP